MPAGRQSRYLAAVLMVGALVPIAISADLTPDAVKQREEQKKVKARIDEQSRRLLHRARYGCWNVFGCSQAWHRKVFETFGPLRDYVVAEDRSMEFRCWALGSVVMVDEYLVQYRVHGSNVSAQGEGVPEEEKKRGYARNLKVQYAMLRQFLVDLDRIEMLNLHPVTEIQLARQAIVRNLGANLLEQKYLQAVPAHQVALGLNALVSINPKTGLKWILRSLHLR